MCQQCINAVKEYLPLIADNDIGSLLISATCFPFGDAEMVERQVRELAEKTDGSLDACCAFADSVLDREMAKLRSVRIFEGIYPGVS